MYRDHLMEVMTRPPRRAEQLYSFRKLNVQPVILLHYMPTTSFIPLTNLVLMILKHLDLRQVSTVPRLWEVYLPGKRVAFIMMGSSPTWLNLLITTTLT